MLIECFCTHSFAMSLPTMPLLMRYFLTFGTPHMVPAYDAAYEATSAQTTLSYPTSVANDGGDTWRVKARMNRGQRDKNIINRTGNEKDDGVIEMVIKSPAELGGSPKIYSGSRRRCYGKVEWVGHSKYPKG